MLRILTILLVFTCYSVSANIFEKLNEPDGALLIIFHQDPDCLFEQNASGIYAIEWLMFRGRVSLMQELIAGNHWIVHFAIEKNLIKLIQYIANNVRGTWIEKRVTLRDEQALNPYQRAKQMKREEIKAILVQRGYDPWWTPNTHF